MAKGKAELYFQPGDSVRLTVDAFREMDGHTSRHAEIDARRRKRNRAMVRAR